jgi:hypothetical protein
MEVPAIKSSFIGVTERINNERAPVSSNTFFVIFLPSIGINSSVIIPEY